MFLIGFFGQCSYTLCYWSNEELDDRDVCGQETANQKVCSNYDHNYPIANDLLYPCKTAGFRRFQTHVFVLRCADRQHRVLDCATQARKNRFRVVLLCCLLKKGHTFSWKEIQSN